MTSPQAPSGVDTGLLPCPFCGDPASFGHAHDGSVLVGCSGVHGVLMRGFTTIDFMVSAWNRRVVSAPQPERSGGAFNAAFYDELLAHALSALRERKPFQINADGAYTLIQQAAADRLALSAVTSGSLGPSPDGDTHCATDGAVVAASPLEISFGCLWRAVTDDTALHGARQHIARLIGPEGKRRGVQWAVANLPEVTDAEIRSIEI